MVLSVWLRRAYVRRDLGEGESSVRYDDAQGVATQGLSPTRLGEDESSVRYVSISARGRQNTFPCALVWSDARERKPAALEQSGPR